MTFVPRSPSPHPTSEIDPTKRIAETKTTENLIDFIEIWNWPRGYATPRPREFSKDTKNRTVMLL